MKVLLYNIENYLQYRIISYNRKEDEKTYIYVKHVLLNQFAVCQKLSQQCKSTIFKKE